MHKDQKTKIKMYIIFLINRKPYIGTPKKCFIMQAMYRNFTKGLKYPENADTTLCYSTSRRNKKLLFSLL